MTLKTVLFGAALACSLFAAPAVAKEKSSEAEDVTTADLSGEWSFIANTGDDCSFTGLALLLPTDSPDQFSCELTALQVCTTETWQVRQSCSARRLGDQLVINSEIEEFVQGEATGAYLPDNFSLKIKSADFMKGVLLSWGSHIAEFRRTEGTIS
ncbi:MAG: hypothetical protein CMK07_08615 [Ponticaulis sp.]|nr:hypothetical protein [Ponticaulis sp.]